jgi:hypothetical protein
MFEDGKKLQRRILRGAESRFEVLTRVSGGWGDDEGQQQRVKKMRGEQKGELGLAGHLPLPSLTVRLPLSLLPPVCLP